MNHVIHLIRTVVGIIGNITSFFLFFSPAFTFWRIYKNKSVEQFHPYPYLAGVLNCVFWVWYAMPFVHPDSILIMTINSVGLVLELSYLLIFSLYASKKQRYTVGGGLLGEVGFTVAIMAITMTVFHTTATRSMFVGIVCVIFGIILYGSPLSIMRKVIRTKSVEYMPFWICMAGFSNGIVWAIYACLGGIDPYVLTGNGIGAILGAIQLSMHIIYRKTTPVGGDDQKPKPSEVQLQNAANRTLPV